MSGSYEQGAVRPSAQDVWLASVHLVVRSEVAASVFVLIMAVGVAPGQAPPNPMISGPIIAVLSAAILLISAPRFFGHEPR